MISPDMCSRPAFPPWSKKATTLIMNGSRKPVKPTEKSPDSSLQHLRLFQICPLSPVVHLLYRSFTNQYGRGVGVIETAKQCKSIFKSIISYEKKITEMLPVSMFSMSPAILSILMISQPTIPMIFQNITNLLILTRIPLPYRVPSQIRKNTSPD